MIVKLALRNLLRNRWRSVLTAGGVALAVAMMIWTVSFLDGWMGAMVRGTTALESLQVKIERADYVEEPRIDRAFELTEGLVESLERDPEVSAISARARLFGLLGDERRSRVAQVIGVNAVREAGATPIEEAIVQGRWLSAQDRAQGPGEVVLGETLARQLETGVGAELVVFLEAADGSLGNDVFEVVGVVHTGTSTVDRQAAYVHLERAQYLGALEGRVHEVAVGARDLSAAPALAQRLEPVVARALPEEVMAVRPWQKVLPSVAELVELSGGSNAVMYLIIYLVASLGIMNTQRMSALERRREFGVLMAIGVSPRRLFWVVMVETVVLGVLGAVFGVVIGTAVSLYHARAGIDLSVFSAQTSFSYMGVSFSERIYTVVGAGTVLEPPLVMILVSLLCGLWPATQSARVEIAPAISGRS
ncbi:hypothetical protein DL240_08280 [Lujinxingia litoralis]|uniref:ABC transporter permease n=1 Tax=Lujinxingia litoralis TaxID=2211119 RepID=A0A328C878_9DELT|nr:ABC transporter permease [Lujinxingia litoralis]RAL22880.1 hypothetical protein DL240_08280 [Lujinxingia litoralis]